MLCGTGCVTDIPAIAGAACRIVTRPAGFDRVVFKRCDYTFTDINSVSEWASAYADGKVGVTGRVLGSKPKGSPTAKKVASCIPERTTNYTRNWQWKDSNADLTGMTEYDFYQFVDMNQDVLMIGFLTCDDLLFGFFDSYSLDVDDTRSDTSDDDAPIECAVALKQRYISKPMKIPGLGAALTSAVGS